MPGTTNAVMLGVTPSPSTTVGLQVFANANLSGFGNPAGSVTFRLFSPQDGGTPVFTSTVPVTGPSVNSASFPTSLAGTYTWTATYNGDASNGPQSAGPAPVVVDKARAVLSVKASPFSGGVIRATARLAGGFRPTGSVTFVLTRDDGSAPCAQNPPELTVVVPVNGAGDYDSGPFTPAVSGTYRWRASYSGDTNSRGVSITSCLDPEASVDVNLPPATTGRFNPLDPARILDTRRLGAPVGGGATIDVAVAGRGGVPATGAVEVALNVTVTQPTASESLTLFPSGGRRPAAPQVTFDPGKTVPNLVVTTLGAAGAVSIFNATGASHVVIDVAGWWSGVPAGNDGRYQPVLPARLLDTRTGVGSGIRLGPCATVEVQVAGRGGVPASGAEAVVLNVAAANTSGSSFLTAFPTGQPQPVASNVNFDAGETVSNRAIVRLGAGGRITIANFAGSTDVVVDVAGWYTDGSQAGAGGVFSPVPQARIVDSASSVGGVTGPLAPNGVVEVQVAGRGGVPSSGIRAAVLNVLVSQPATSGFLSVFPAGSGQPTASDLNFTAGETRANLAIATVNPAGQLGLSSSAACQVAIDVVGYYT